MKKKKLKRTRTISAITWNRLYAAYLKTGNISAAATEAGVTGLVATKYIRRGDPDRGLPAIEQMQREEAVARATELEQHRTRELKLMAGLSAHLLTEQAKAVPKIELGFTGPKSAEGKTIVPIRDFRTLVTALKETHALGANVYNERAGKQNGININVNASANATVVSDVDRLRAEDLNYWADLEKAHLSADELKCNTAERARLLARKIAGPAIAQGATRIAAQSSKQKTSKQLRKHKP